jgi:small subunit ribosomal protein S16
MVKIRLARAGANKKPVHRITAIDQRRQTGARALEFLGTSDPTQNPERLLIRSEALEAWVKKGAQLSPTVKRLVKQFGKKAA